VSVPGAVSDPSRVAAREVAFPGHGADEVRGYLALPASLARPGPGVIVIHEAMGLNEHIRDVARRFANAGYAALAPDLYTREGAPPEELEAVMRAMQAVPDERVIGDLEGAAAALAQADGVIGRLGCIGFCSGGRQCLLFACNTARLSAAVDCWGGYIRRASRDALTTPERPVPPIEMVERLGCPLMVAIGAEDQNPSVEDGEALRERLEAAGKEYRLDVYEGAGHAFFADYRPTYRPEAARALWARVLEFFGEHLR